MSDTLPIVVASLGIFLTIGVGALIRRLGWLKPAADDSITRIIVNLLIPALILDKLLGNPALDQTSNLFLAPLVGAGTIGLGFVMAWILGRFAAPKNPVVRHTFSFCTGMYNYAYIPLPLAIALFDRETVGVLFLHNLGVDIMMWTVGVMLVSMAGMQGGWKHIINGPVIGVILGILLTKTGAYTWIPSPFMAVIHSIAGCAIPVALIMIGALIFDLAHWRLFHEGQRTLAWAMAIRLGLLPLCILGLMALLPVTLELKRVMVLQAAMPCAVFPIVITRHYGGDLQTAIRIAVATSLVSIVTTPAWVWVGLRLLASL